MNMLHEMHDELAETIHLTLEMTPADATRWSLRTMVAAVGHAPPAIHRCQW